MNVLMISIDNLRYDCVGYQSDKRELEKHDVLKYLETPMLDSIAGGSLCFTQCISTSTYTTSSHASIFTALYQPRHGVRAFYDTKLDKGVVTIAEVLKKNGYRTILYTDTPHLFNPLDLNRGFDLNLSIDDEKLFNLLRDLGGEKIFLFVHFFDVHEPFLHNTNDFRAGINEDFLDEMYKLYKKHNLLKSFGRNGEMGDLWNKLYRGPLSKRSVDVLFPLYVKGITKFDKGRLNYFLENLRNINFLKNALTAVFSDHGEGRCSHEEKNYFNHSGDLYDNVLRVPLMIQHPDLRPGVENTLVSTVDIFQTILFLLNIARMKDTDGINIFSEKRRMTYAESWKVSADLCVASDGCVKGVEGHWPESMLRQRAVRTETQKFVIYSKGKTKKFFDENKNLSEHEYVKRLYRDILGRFEDSEGYQHYLNMLKQGLRTKKELFHAFLESEEFKAFPARAVYNLRKDHEEDHPSRINPFSMKTRKYFNYMHELERKAVISEKIFDDQETAEKVVTKTQYEEEHTMENGKRSPVSLEEKEAKAISIIKQAVELFGIEQIGAAWTGGKDSTTVLHLIKQAFGGHIPIKVINIDTSVKFPEIYEFRDRLHKEWGFDLMVFNNDDAAKWLKISKDHAECCYQLKTVPLNQAIVSLGLKALITGVRWDEQEARKDEKYFSPRENPVHMRVQPILHFKEADIWEYIKKYHITYCELYDKGYRSLGCAPCTSPSSGTGPERSGRARDKEEIMARLRELGYF